MTGQEVKGYGVGLKTGLQPKKQNKITSWYKQWKPLQRDSKNDNI